MQNGNWWKFNLRLQLNLWHKNSLLSSYFNSSAELKLELSLRRRTAAHSDQTLTRRTKVVMVRPSQSPMLKVKKQHTEMKKRSAARTNKCLTISFQHVTVCMSMYMSWMQHVFYWRQWGEAAGSYPISPGILFSHLLLQLGRRTAWLWTQTSRRTPSPRSENQRHQMFI